MEARVLKNRKKGLNCIVFLKIKCIFIRTANVKPYMVSSYPAGLSDNLFSWF